MSDTPRTDKALFHLIVCGAFPETVEFARQLERELNAKPEQSPSGEGVEPTDEMVSVCLQTFRHEMNRLMDLKHPSWSPGHDSMRIALRAALAITPASPQKVHVTPEK